MQPRKQLRILRIFLAFFFSNFGRRWGDRTPGPRRVKATLYRWAKRLKSFSSSAERSIKYLASSMSEVKGYRSCHNPFKEFELGFWYENLGIVIESIFFEIIANPTRTLSILDSTTITVVYETPFPFGFRITKIIVKPTLNIFSSVRVDLIIIIGFEVFGVCLFPFSPDVFEYLTHRDIYPLLAPRFFLRDKRVALRFFLRSLRLTYFLVGLLALSLCLGMWCLLSWSRSSNGSSIFPPIVSWWNRSSGFIVILEK